MKIKTAEGTIILSESRNDKAWFFRTYPFKVVWYLESTQGRQESKRFADSTEMTQFLLGKWGGDVVGIFKAANPFRIPPLN